MEDVSRYAGGGEFDPDGIRPSDAVNRAFILNCADIYALSGEQKIEFTSSEFIRWYENEIEVIKRAMLERIYKELSG